MIEGVDLDLVFVFRPLFRVVVGICAVLLYRLASDGAFVFFFNVAGK